MKPRWSRRARRDLMEIGDYIAKDNPKAARRVTAAIEKRAHRIPLHPKAARVVPEWERQDTREVLWRRYRIVYRIEPKGIRILTVFEGHRLLSLEAGEEQ